MPDNHTLIKERKLKMNNNIAMQTTSTSRTSSIFPLSSSAKLKILYVCVSMLINSTIAFLPSYLRVNLNILKKDLGIVACFACMASFLGSIAWSSMADWIGSLRGKQELALIGITGYCVILSCLPWFEMYKEMASHGVRVTLISVVCSMANFFGAAPFPIVDSQVLGYLAWQQRSKTNHISKHTFGKVRMWGTIGHIIVLLAASLTIEPQKFFDHVLKILRIRPDQELTHDKNDTESRGNLRAIFWVMWTSAILFALAVVFLMEDYHARLSQKESELEITDKTPLQEKNVSASKSRSERIPLSMRIRMIISNPSFMLFLAITMMIGWSRSIIGFWQNDHISQELKKSSTFVAIMNVTRLVSEMVIYYWSSNLLNAMGGARWMLVLCQLAGTVRIAFYGWLHLKKYPWVIISLELLKAVSSASFTSSAVEIATQLVNQNEGDLIRISNGRGNNSAALKGKSRILTFALGCMHGIYNGLSQSLAGISGYWILEWCNDKFDQMCQIATWISGIALFVYLVIILFLIKSEPAESKDERA